MGLSFHYSGRFNPDSSLYSMIGEAEDIAKVHKWPYHIFENRFPEKAFTNAGHDGKLYGMCFTPPGCETVSLCFLSDGRMSSPGNLQCWGKPENETEREYLYMVSVKTQYAGMQIHIQVIQFLKYFSKTYLLDVKVMDEGEYWETGEEKRLEEIFDRYTFAINTFTTALETFPLNEGETLEEYLIRMAKKVQKQTKKKN